MLIQVETHTGTEFINPEQITTVQILPNYAVLVFSDKYLSYIDRDVWERIKPALVSETGRLQERYDAALRVVYTQAIHTQALEKQISELIAELEKVQSPRSRSTDDDNPSPTYDGLPF